MYYTKKPVALGECGRQRYIFYLYRQVKEGHFSVNQVP